MTHSIRIFTGRAIFGLPSRSEPANHQDTVVFTIHADDEGIFPRLKLLLVHTANIV